MPTFLIKTRIRLAQLRAAVSPLPPLVFEKLFFFGGLGLIGYGVYLIYKPLGFIVGGLIVFWLATLISQERH